MAEPSPIVQSLINLGFNLNEGRAYVALLKIGPATGYEVGQKASVPRSAVYGALRRLAERGAARSIAGSPERFVATPATDLVGLLEKRFSAQKESLESALASLDTAPDAPDAFSVRGYNRILEEAARLVASSDSLLCLSGWPRELEQLAEELTKAKARGVDVVVFSHAALSPALAGEVYSYGLRPEDLAAFWQPRLVIVADDCRTLVGAVSRKPDDAAVVSETRAIAELAVGQMALDITLLGQRFKKDLSALMARLLGDRVGSLDSLLAEKRAPQLGE